MTNEILKKINMKINQLNYRINQIYYAKNNIKPYYAELIRELREEIKDLEAQYVYQNNSNTSDTIDLHGSTKYFIDYYIDDLIYEKFNSYNKIIIITGKGTFTLFNHLKKHLTKYNYNFKIKDYTFVVDK